MSKLTKDQKRAKAKREEQKRQRTKQHTINAQVKTVGQTLTSLGVAMQGGVSAEQIEEQIVDLAGGARPDDQIDPFSHPAWRDFKPRLSNLVGMLRTGSMTLGRPAPMQGRVYLIDKEDRSFSTVSVPTCMVELARWPTEIVLKKIAEELSIEPVEGIYCYGLRLGQVAIHFAFVHHGGKDGFVEIYLVTPTGWHYLIPDKYYLYLEPMLDFTRNQTAEAFGLREPEQRMRFHLKAFPEAIKMEAELGEGHRRKTLISMLQDSMEECDVILEFAHNHHRNHGQKTYDNGFEDGFAERKGELKEAQEALSALKMELQVAKAKAAAHPPSQVSKPALPLHERMAHLLAPLQA